jgi:hypothetical protein
MRGGSQLFNGYDGKNSFEYAVALNYVPGWSAIRKFGDNDDVPNTGSEEMWPPGTARVLPTSAGVVSIVSTSTADDEAAVGTGGWTLHIEGLDANFDEVDIHISLDGTNPVTTTTELIRVNRAYFMTAGTNETNVGDISMSIGGNLQAFITAGEGQTSQTHYTVPRNHVALLNALNIGVGRMVASSDLHCASQIKTVGGTWRSISDVYLYNGGSVFRNGDAIVVVPEKTEIRQVITSTSTTQCYSVWQGMIVDMRYLHNYVPDLHNALME